MHLEGKKGTAHAKVLVGTSLNVHSSWSGSRGAKAEGTRGTTGDEVFRKEGNRRGGRGQIFYGFMVIIKPLAFTLTWEAIGGLSGGVTGSDLHLNSIILAPLTLTIIVRQ